MGFGMGRRIVAMGGLILSGVLLLIGIRLTSPLQAIAVISLSVAFLQSTEPAFWSSTIHIGGSSSGAAGGIMNTAGNLGGVVSTALVPVLVKYFGWTFAFSSAAGLAIFGALLWLFMRLDPPGATQEKSALPDGQGELQAI
jgi:sugar phosphate permease